MAEGYFECDVRCSTINTQDGRTKVRYHKPKKIEFENKFLWIRNIQTSRHIDGQYPRSHRTIPMEDIQTLVIGYSTNGELEYLPDSKDLVFELKDNEIDVLSEGERVRLKARTIIDIKEQDRIRNYLLDTGIVHKAAKIDFAKASDLEQLASIA